MKEIKGIEEASQTYKLEKEFMDSFLSKIILNLVLITQDLLMNLLTTLILNKMKTFYRQKQHLKTMKN